MWGPFKTSLECLGAWLGHETLAQEQPPFLTPWTARGAAGPLTSSLPASLRPQGGESIPLSRLLPSTPGVSLPVNQQTWSAPSFHLFADRELLLEQLGGFCITRRSLPELITEPH